MIPIHLEFHWNRGKDIVTAELLLPPLPAVLLVLPTEEFFVFCEGVVQIAKPFIDGVKDKLAKGEAGELKVEISGPDLEKLLKLKHDFEENRGSDDVERQ